MQPSRSRASRKRNSALGANVAGACEVARAAGSGAVVVTVLPDRGDRYFAPMKWEKQYVW